MTLSTRFLDISILQNLISPCNTMPLNLMQNLGCVIITPFGKYKYKHLPMGLKCSPDFVHQIMEQVLCSLDNIDVYLDDIGVFGTSWNEHQVLLDKVLSHLEANGFIVNPLKCAWSIQETNCLGYWWISMGLKPWKKCIS
ncbi:hypothetical protein ACHAXS_008433 [Conticribra weissflogii]